MTIYEAYNIFEEQYDARKITLKNYKAWIFSFFRYIIQNYGIENIEDIEVKHIKEFKEYLIEQNKKGNTINAHIRVIKIFYQFLEQNGIHHDIAIGIKTLKNFAVEVRKILSIDEIDNLMKNFNIDKLNDCRDLIAIMLMLNHALRNHEVVRIRISDINFRNNSILIKSKGTFNYDLIFINDDIKKILKYYIKKFNFEKNDYLIKSRKGNKLSLRHFNRSITERLRRAGVDGCSVYSLRHTAGTLFFQQKKDIFLTQKFLRHKSTNTTQRYLNSLTNTVTFKKGLSLDLVNLKSIIGH